MCAEFYSFGRIESGDQAQYVFGMALYFRGYGPPSTRKDWPEEEEDEEEGLADPEKGVDFTGDRDPEKPLFP